MKTNLYLLKPEIDGYQLNNLGKSKVRLFHDFPYLENYLGKELEYTINELEWFNRIDGPPNGIGIDSEATLRKHLTGVQEWIRNGCGGLEWSQLDGDDRQTFDLFALIDRLETAFVIHSNSVLPNRPNGKSQIEILNFLTAMIAVLTEVDERHPIQRILEEHHGYQDGSVRRLEPISLARLEQDGKMIPTSTSSDWFKKNWGSHTDYVDKCKEDIDSEYRCNGWTAFRFAMLNNDYELAKKIRGRLPQTDSLPSHIKPIKRRGKKK